jgi:hypothetical protein
MDPGSFPSKADIRGRDGNVRLVPTAAIAQNGTLAPLRNNPSLNYWKSY